MGAVQGGGLGGGLGDRLELLQGEFTAGLLLAGLGLCITCCLLWYKAASTPTRCVRPRCKYTKTCSTFGWPAEQRAGVMQEGGAAALRGAAALGQQDGVGPGRPAAGRHLQQGHRLVQVAPHSLPLN